ncbi:hypothetical protein C0Z10_09455 [Acidipropionibacterium jensenii]|uniref:Uncharacterized protein n=1 Tax=Acidipropionibacterium jensenii TaxID=1749 RepID=A0A3T0S0Y6_9ACTN|nr:hypothetical protein [Acidipropionibacterium jensenii]AZZ39941.1 hypothetical protein C0Z10_09455 [Acidipropionibacterium jensenii]
MSTTTKNPVIEARARLAVRTRFGAPAEELAVLRTELERTKVERAIRHLVDAAPPVSAERRAELANMLIGGGAR